METNLQLALKAVLEHQEWHPKEDCSLLIAHLQALVDAERQRIYYNGFDQAPEQSNER